MENIVCCRRRVNALNPAAQGSTVMGEIDRRFSRIVWIRGGEEEEESEKRERE